MPTGAFLGLHRLKYISVYLKPCYIAIPWNISFLRFCPLGTLDHFYRLQRLRSWPMPCIRIISRRLLPGSHARRDLAPLFLDVLCRHDSFSPKSLAPDILSCLSISPSWSSSVCWGITLLFRLPQ